MNKEEKRRAALRAARKERQAAATSPGSTSSTDVAPKGTSRSAAAEPVGTTETPADPRTAGAAPGKMVTAAIADPSTADSNSALEMVLFNEKTAEPHWVGFLGGEPAFKVAYAQQDDEFKKGPGLRAFVARDYAQTIKQATAKIPLVKILTDIHAETYTARVTEAAAYKDIEKKVVADKSAEFTERSATLIDDFSNVLALVVHAERNNFLPGSPLKAALYNAMQKVGVAQPLPVIEEACIEAYDQHFDSMFKQAKHWMGLHPEALAEIKDQIMGSGHRMPTVTADTRAPSHRGNAIPSEEHNVPLTSMKGTGNPVSSGERTANLKEEIRNKYQFSTRSRLKHMLPNG